MITRTCVYCSTDVIVGDGTLHAVCSKCFQYYGFTFGPRFSELKAFDVIIPAEKLQTNHETVSAKDKRKP